MKFHFYINSQVTSVKGKLSKVNTQKRSPVKMMKDCSCKLIAQRWCNWKWLQLLLSPPTGDSDSVQTNNDKWQNDSVLFKLYSLSVCVRACVFVSVCMRVRQGGLFIVCTIVFCGV